MMSNAVKNFDILAINLNVLHNSPILIVKGTSLITFIYCIFYRNFDILKLHETNDFAEIAKNLAKYRSQK